MGGSATPAFPPAFFITHLREKCTKNMSLCFTKYFLRKTKKMVCIDYIVCICFLILTLQSTLLKCNFFVIQMFITNKPLMLFK